MKKEIRKVEKHDVSVRVHTPVNVPERVKQDKINRLYDLLKPKEDSPPQEKNIA